MNAGHFSQPAWRSKIALLAWVTKNLETLGAHSSVWQVAFSSDGQCLAAGYADGTINLWK